VEGAVIRARGACTRTALAALVLGLSLGLVSCAAVLSAIEDRLPAPHEVKNGFLFSYYAPSARQVTLAGNFNNWGGTQGGGRYDPTIDPMSDTNGDGVWTIVVPLPPGRYQYKFVIDGGVRWEEDPSNPDKAFEAGIENSLILVPPTVKYRYQAVTGTVIAGETAGGSGVEESQQAVDVDVSVDFPSAKKVFIAGTFNNWSPDSDQLAKGAGGKFHITLHLDPGKYEYKFVVDGTWTEDPGNQDTVADPYGGVNSVLTVK
jgi:1,4-alpha-glucan branching enzyme